MALVHAGRHSRDQLLSYYTCAAHWGSPLLSHVLRDRYRQAWRAGPHHYLHQYYDALRPVSNLSTQPMPCLLNPALEYPTHLKFLRRAAPSVASSKMMMSLPAAPPPQLTPFTCAPIHACALSMPLMGCLGCREEEGGGKGGVSRQSSRQAHPRRRQSPPPKRRASRSLVQRAAAQPVSNHLAVWFSFLPV